MTENSSRIWCHNTLNLVIDKWIEPTAILNGPKRGEISEGHWKIHGYYGNSLNALAKGVIDVISSDLEPSTNEDVISPPMASSAPYGGIYSKCGGV